MSEDEIRLSCLENNGYETPELNDKLYLHFRGFKRIENLQKYTGCKSLWLDSNGFDRIENLSALVELRCLYLSKNLISRVEGLETLQQLTILDLSNNRLTRLENLACCPALQTLNIAHNSLASAEAIGHLRECEALTTLDLTQNLLPAEEEVMQTLRAVPKMVTLSINGNEVTRLPAFRKRLISLLPNLGYLDRPVDERERVCAEAFVRGGAAAEEEARIAWKAEQDLKRQQEQEAYRAWQADQRKLREEARAAGRPLITPFTQEEQEQRQREAEAAAEAERRMLSHGVDELARRYWQLEGRGELGDLLDRAAEQLEMDYQQPPTPPPVEISVAPLLPPLPPSTKEMEAVEKEMEKGEEEEEEHSKEISTKSIPHEVNEGTQASTQIITEAIDAAVLSSEKVKQQELAREAAEEAERQQRVADSLQLYLRQLKGGAPSVSTHSSTWDNVSSAVPVHSEENRPLYWSEAMDLSLAKAVQSCVFDFDAIAIEMQQAAQQGRLANHAVHSKPSLLTNEVCRLRWGELDASQWSQPAPGVTAQHTIFRNHITEGLLQHTKGAQPTFEALQAMAASQRPAYLKAPVSFPSVSEYEELD
eukprot:scaffold1491_cov167-Ochromonas_danica.AAC.7